MVNTLGGVTPVIKVAVCTNRPAASVAPSLEALRAQVPEDRVLVVLSATSPAGFGGPVLVEPRPGLSHARNRALAWCASDDEVLAFVDDDAIVDPAWYTDLSARWEEAPDSVACIGGPIRPEWSGEPPGWISGPLLPALTVLDLGGQVRDLDPTVTTVYGANISFRTGPLRRAGGFDPAFGHTGAGIGFSEEDEAERALARLGFGVRYVPDAGVRHVIPPGRLARGSFIRRRFAYGRTLGRRGARGRALAARQALSSTVGAAAAAVTTDDRLMMERAVRAAENLGVLSARRRGGPPVP